MKIKISKRLINILILGGCVTFIGCAKKVEQEEPKPEPIVIDVPTTTPTIIEKEVKEEKEDNNVSEDKIAVSNNEINVYRWDIPKYVTYVDAVNNTSIYSNTNQDSEILGELKRHDRLVKKDDYFNDYYEVEYNGQTAFVPKENTKVEVKQEFNHNFTKVVKIKKDASIYTDDCLDNPIVIYDDFEIAEVYQEHDDIYLVKTIDYVGYVRKEDTEDILDDTFVVVDKSNQNMLLYNNNEIIVDTPVVTGKPISDRDTPLGDYNIWYSGYDRDLVGADYRVHVDSFWAFKDGYGIHDANWRPQGDFNNNETWKTKGSHGCVNAEIEQIQKMKNYVKTGTRVFIKP